MLQATGGVARFILEIQLYTGKTRQRQRNKVSIGTALKISLDDTNRFTRPLAIVDHDVSTHLSTKQQY
ncbi:hypothetical protein D3C80_1584310 [compost metagenome]